MYQKDKTRYSNNIICNRYIVLTILPFNKFFPRFFIILEERKSEDIDSCIEQFLFRLENIII